MLDPKRTNTILYCQRWRETVSFYRDLLKLAISFENDWFVEFQLNKATFLSIANADRASIKAVHGQGITLSWQTSDVSELQKKLQSVGIETTPIQTKWDARLFYFSDPEGHRIELWQSIEASDHEFESSTNCDLATSVPDWLIDHPQLLPLFKVINIDCCCGGKSLEVACHERGLDPETIYANILQLIDAT